MRIRYIQPTDTTCLQLKRVAAYARVSNDKDQMMHSLSQQVSYYNDYINKRPDWAFVGIYTDEGISGTKDDRPGFVGLTRAAQAHEFDMVITKSVTRFARNTLTLLKTIREYKELGIDVYFEKENLHTISKDGEMMLTLLAMYAEEEARSASENKKWQIRRGFEQGRPVCFKIYGYKWVDGHLEAVPEEAAVVKWIYEMYLEGNGSQKIATMLNKEGVSQRGKKWRSNMIDGMLANEKYKGDLLLQKYYTPDFRTKRHYINQGERRRYLVSGSHEPIISEETYMKVQTEIERRGQEHKTKKLKTAVSNETRLFTGKLKCGICGGGYIRKRASHNADMHYWMCYRYAHGGKDDCNSKQIRESILIDATQKVLGIEAGINLTPEMIEQGIEKIEVLKDNRLRYYLKSGRIITMEWANPSRSKSWTPEMRERARQQTLARLK